MKLFFYAPQPKSLVLRAFLTKRKERKLQYQWYHNFRSYLVASGRYSPYEQMLEILGSERYAPIAE